MHVPKTTWDSSNVIPPEQIEQTGDHFQHFDTPNGAFAIPTKSRSFIGMLKMYIIYYQYQVPGDKKPGPVRQFRVYASSLAEAKNLAAEQAQYPNIEVLRIKSG